jgi:pimeloyl-ACP methyl ester carboxylesterase
MLNESVDGGELVAGRVRQALPGSRVEQLPECDHLLLYDQPALTAQVILTFLGIGPDSSEKTPNRSAELN